MRSSSRFILRSASAHRLASDPENCALPSRIPARRPTSFTPSGERVEVDVAAVGRAGELQRRHAARAHDVVDLVVALVVHARGVHPPVDVPAAIARGTRTCSPTASVTGAPGALDLVGELHAGGRRADDQHAAVVELAGVAVLHRRQRRDRRAAAPARKRARWAMLHAPVASTTRPAVPVAVVGRDAGSRRRVRAHRVTVVLRPHRGGDRLRVALDERDRPRASS